MKKNREDRQERVFANYDNREVIETLYEIDRDFRHNRYPGGFPFLAEVIRRLLDRWALGEDPDPWLPFPHMFNASSIYSKPIGVFRYWWASPGEMFKLPCQCGAYRYAVDFNRWFSSAWGYYSCIGCNSFGTVLIGGPTIMDSKISMSAIHVYSNKRNGNYHPQAEDMLKLLKLLEMEKNLRDLLKNKAVQERQKRA